MSRVITVKKNHTVYCSALNKLVDDLFQEATRRQIGWEDLSEKSGLCVQTIMKLGYRETVYPQYRSVVLIAHALGATVGFKHTRIARAYIIKWRPEPKKKRRKKSNKKDKKPTLKLKKA